ncbi:sterol desaturase family protein [Oleomonas cavernae]|uniref:Sterol desaturase family protein n=2 Tax=Oleomonas cavernae TaxID=2320859 RepID=A0A418WD50_9PROT|nr:sterol desaturase family protein [Oleomonas cavernae]
MEVSMGRTIIRWAAYPLVVGISAAAIIAITRAGLPYWPWMVAVSLAGIAAVAGLERLAPHHVAWAADQGDLKADLAHNAVNLSVLHGSAATLGLVVAVTGSAGLWPLALPLAVQILLVGLVIDFGLYTVHRISHRVPWLWRFHAIHHAPRRLYWLNGERRHPLHALIMAGPGISLCLGLGAPVAAIAAWLALTAVHLAFQHANLDYTVGPLRRWLGTAEVHRFHHKRDYTQAEVNFGEVFMIWDRLFGTFEERPAPLGADEVGISPDDVPAGYGGQMAYPFRRRLASARQAS